MTPTQLELLISYIEECALYSAMSATDDEVSWKAVRSAEEALRKAFTEPQTGAPNE